MINFVELLHRLLRSWALAGRAFLLLIGLCLVFLGTVYVFLRTLRQQNAEQVEVSKFLTVAFRPDPSEQKEATDKATEYAIVVQPHSWEETGIEVKRGDIIQIAAGGSVTIDMWGINNYSLTRNVIDNTIIGKANISPSGKDSPERHYDDLSLRDKIYEQLNIARGLTGQPKLPKPPRSSPTHRSFEENLKPSRGWTGPDGYSESPSYDTTVHGRSERKVDASSPFGALIAAFRPEISCTPDQISRFAPGCVPSRAEPKYRVGHCWEMTVGEEPQSKWSDSMPRRLWLIVNDVWDDQDDVFPEKFYIDNLGFYYARVRVIPVGQKPRTPLCR